MKFEPKTEEQIVSESLLAAGIYDIEVRDAVDKTSKAGNDMVHLKLSVFDEDGNSVFVDDYLLESMPLKLRRAAYALGLGGEYESGELAAYDFKGKAGKAKIGIQKGKAKEDGSGEFYPDKNGVLDYIVGESPKGIAPARKSPSQVVAPIEDDEIPF